MQRLRLLTGRHSLSKHTGICLCARMAPRHSRPRIQDNIAAANEPWSSLLPEQPSEADRRQLPLQKPHRYGSFDHAYVKTASEKTPITDVDAVDRSAGTSARGNKCIAGCSTRREDVADAGRATEELQQENELLRAQLQAVMTKNTLRTSASVSSDFTENEPPPKSSPIPMQMSVPFIHGVAGVPLLGSQVPMTMPLQGEHSQQTDCFQRSPLSPSPEISQRGSLLPNFWSQPPLLQHVPVILMPQHLQVPQQYLQQFDLPQQPGCSRENQSVPLAAGMTLAETFQKLREEQHRQQRQLDLLQMKLAVQSSSQSSSDSLSEIATAKHSADAAASLSSAVGRSFAAAPSSPKAGDKSVDGNWCAEQPGAGIPSFQNLTSPFFVQLH